TTFPEGRSASESSTNRTGQPPFSSNARGVDHACEGSHHRGFNQGSTDHLFSRMLCPWLSRRQGRAASRCQVSRTRLVSRRRISGKSKHLGHSRYGTVC